MSCSQPQQANSLRGNFLNLFFPSVLAQHVTSENSAYCLGMFGSCFLIDAHLFGCTACRPGALKPTAHYDVIAYWPDLFGFKSCQFLVLSFLHCFNIPSGPKGIIVESSQRESLQKQCYKNGFVVQCCLRNSCKADDQQWQQDVQEGGFSLPAFVVEKMALILHDGIHLVIIQARHGEVMPTMPLHCYKLSILKHGY